MNKDEELILCKVGEKINLKIHNIEIIPSKLPIFPKEYCNIYGLFNIKRIENFIKENNVNKNNYKEMWSFFELLYYGNLNNDDKILYNYIFNNNNNGE